MAPRSPLPSYRIIHAEAPLPDDFTHAHGLIALYGLQQWEAMGQGYAPGYFYKLTTIASLLHGLANTTRHTAFGHLATAACLVCDAPIDLTRTEGDHIIPRAAGGSDVLQNTLLFCRRCNSSKGTKDLLAWWQDKGYDPLALPRTVVCLYARALWQHWEYPGLRVHACPLALRTFLTARLRPLPSDEHRIALIGAAYAASAYVAWLGREVTS